MSVNQHDNGKASAKEACLSRKLNRRTFLTRLGGLTAATLTAGAGCAPSLGGVEQGRVHTRGRSPKDTHNHGERTNEVRQQAAMVQSDRLVPAFPSNGDENVYPTKLASYSKCLPHNERGEVELGAYAALVKAIETRQHSAFEAVPLGGGVKFANPQAAYAFEREWLDLRPFEISAPPAFDSAETASEMIELYWQALTRDVLFGEYDSHPLINAAAADLSQCADFHGSRVNRAVTPATLFRGPTPGDLTGVYLSQFLWLDVPQGAITVKQRAWVPVANDDYLTTYPEWLNNQRGIPPAQVNIRDQTPRYLRNSRDLGEYVHKDYTYQAFLNAALILLAMHAPLKVDNPYGRSLTQSGFSTYGAPHVFDCVARVANAALRASWYHKWVVHRRLRPEAFGGRVQNHLTKVAQYPVHKQVLNSTALGAVFRATGTYLLPQAYPEGCPTHPAYPAGHAAIAGACVTVLKAFFNETFVIPSPRMASADGLSLVAYQGPILKVGGELNKLAANIALGRDTAGVHWRSDGIEGLKLGEAIAIGTLAHLKETCPESFDGFSFTALDGTIVTI